MSEARYWQILNELASESPEMTNNALADLIIGRVEAADAADEYWAAETLTRWALEGARRDYNNVHKKVHGVMCITRGGRRVRKTTSYSRPIRSDDSGEIIGYQLQAWWGFGRVQLLELRRDIAEQIERQNDSLEAIDRLIAAMERHPDARTARDAWEADGHSVSEIDLGEAAA